MISEVLHASPLLASTTENILCSPLFLQRTLIYLSKYLSISRAISPLFLLSLYSTFSVNDTELLVFFFNLIFSSVLTICFFLFPSSFQCSILFLSLICCNPSHFSISTILTNTNTKITSSPLTTVFHSFH